MTEMAQVALASVPPKRNLVRKGQLRVAVGAGTVERKEGTSCLWGGSPFQGGFMQSSLGDIFPSQRN